ncbi:MAG TPA: protease pro-enzyme activation domain-containing protein, partial [Candidatus Angelobacter sp.]|nr:protease pro-enzyme activation domain-containing protein [Candidatus Angelobacter sp.]
MHTLSRGRTRLLLPALLLMIFSGMMSSAALAQRSINEADRVVKHGNVHPLARPEFDRGSADLNLPMENMILSLSPRASAKADLDALLADLQNPKSPNFHHFLTPQEFGLRFGPTDQDVADAANWLKSHGFRIEEIANSKLWINFSGNVQQVERAFQTNIRQFEVNGQIHYANATDPSIPRAFSGLVEGVVSLHDFPLHHDANVAQLPGNANNVDGSHSLAPGDFATIYNLTPLYNAGIDGTGQTIAIVGRTDIVLGDVQFFRSTFLLPAKDPIFIHNGNAPGDQKGNEELEADLDVEWSGAVAKNATIKFVISKSTRTTDGVTLSAQYIVNNNVAPVMSTSFGLCEQSLGAAGNTFWNNLWAQAAAEGITAFVSTGDTGAAGCDANTAPVGTIQAVNGIASTPNNIAVGGTEFNEGAGIFWAAGNNPDLSSALGPIPEIVWNESANVPGGVGIRSTGGGVSTIYAKPAFQTGPGVPADGFRDIPDVSLSAAGHDAYLIVQGHTNNVSGLENVFGTSAASPSFAGIMALVVQKTGSPQGNANSVLYSMAATQFAGGTPVFNDITSGNNSVPGVAGFSAAPGYDQATGWGSVNAANLVNAWNNNSPDFTLEASPASQSVIQGGSVSYSAIVTGQNGYVGTVSFTVGGLPTGASFTASPTSITSSGTATISIATSATTPVGTYPLTITGSDGVLSHTASVTLIVNTSAPADFTVSATPSSQTVTAGVNAGYQVNVGSVAGFNGLVNLSVSVSPVVTDGPGASISPNSLSGSGLAALSVTTVPTTPAGTYTFTITGTSGTLVHTATVSLVVNAQGTGDFSISTATNTITVKRGQSGSLPVTISAQAGFTGTVNLSVSGLPSLVTGVFAPTSINTSGTSSLTLTVNNQQRQGTFQIVITGT